MSKRSPRLPAVNVPRTCTLLAAVSAASAARAALGALLLAEELEHSGTWQPGQG